MLFSFKLSCDLTFPQLSKTDWFITLCWQIQTMNRTLSVRRDELCENSYNDAARLYSCVIMLSMDPWGMWNKYPSVCPHHRPPAQQAACQSTSHPRLSVYVCVYVCVCTFISACVTLRCKPRIRRGLWQASALMSQSCGGSLSYLEPTGESWWEKVKANYGGF